MDIRYFLILVALALVGGAQAQIYKVVTPDGHVIYTDSPPEDVPAEEVDLPELIIEPATRVRSQASQPDAQDSEPQINRPLPKPIIASPVEQQVIPPGQRQVTVVAEVSSPVPEGFRYILLINGTIQGDPVSAPVWTVNNPNPGEQRAQVAIVDASGTRRTISDTRVFYVIR